MERMVLVGTIGIILQETIITMGQTSKYGEKMGYMIQGILFYLEIILIIIHLNHKMDGNIELL